MHKQTTNTTPANDELRAKLSDVAPSGEQDAPQEEPAFLVDDGPSDDIPPFISTTNIRELYGWQPGETLAKAMARKKAQEG